MIYFSNKAIRIIFILKVIFIIKIINIDRRTYWQSGISFFWYISYFYFYNNEICKYNSLGNPIIYRNKDILWKYGKYLIKYGDLSFTYDGNGRRISKGNITYSYDSNGRLIKQSNGLEFIYDSTGLIGFKYNNNTYFYQKDIQSNIISIIDSNGETKVQYKYDAWGNHAILDSNGNDINDGIGLLNPFRYRSYYYDDETGLYFLQSRYYDPEVGRFISQDSLEFADHNSIIGLNLYAYCSNNPISFCDSSGHFAVSTFLIGLAASWVISSIASYYLGKHFISGASSVYGGIQTIATGISLLAYGPVGWVLGGAAIALGAVNIAFGTAELQQHFTGNNWINDIGITGNLYTGLYIGSSIASAAVCIGGTTYMNSSAGKLAYEIQKNAKYWDKGTFHTRYESMKYHYKTHAKGMTPTQYTQSAIDFSTFNSSSFKYTYNYKYRNASWNFINMYGVGGYYNSAGKIITFFF